MGLTITPQVTSVSKSGSTPLNGQVTFSEGTNITITQVGNNIEIAASGGTQNLSYNSGTHAVDISGGGTSATIPLAVADGATFGLATFTASDFNSSSGVISIDYTNGQTASGSLKGFLSSADWTTFNNKGDILNGGNTTAATVVVGTNDANSFSIETNNVVRATVTGGASTGGAWTLTQVTANTNTVADILTLQTNSTGTAAASFGTGILFQGESSTTDNRDMARIATYWGSSGATDASRWSEISIYLAQATALTESFKFRGLGNGFQVMSSSGLLPVTLSNASLTTTTGFTIGNSGSQLTLGGSSGTVFATSTNQIGISSTQTSAGAAIYIAATGNSFSTTTSVSFGNATSYTQTSGTRNHFIYNLGFAPTSGTAEHNQQVFNGTINQTGGANGIVRNIYLNPTLTAVADFRGIESTFNTANAWHLYQTGSSAKGNTLVKTSIGTTTAPTALLMLAAGTATANTAPLKMTSGTLLAAPEAGAQEFLTDLYYNTTTTGAVRRVYNSGNTGRVTAQTAANASVATYTLGASDASFRISANVLVTTSSAENFTVTVNYTDEGNTARTATLNFQLVAGTIGTAIASGNGAVPYMGLPIHIRCKASTAITIKTAAGGTYTGCTYNCEGNITQIA